MSTVLQSKHLHLTPTDNRRLADLCGQCDEHLKQLEHQLGVQIHSRGNSFKITGAPLSVQTAGQILVKLYDETVTKDNLSPTKIHLIIQELQEKQANHHTLTDPVEDEVAIPTRKGLIKPRGKNQLQFVRNILTHDINFAVGPAGTGKTYLAVACAVNALEKELVSRLILVRPAVEAGERLGFLPGDLVQKVDPYLRPLYDALYEMLGNEKVTKLLERNVIEIAPLAYMRGRTLSHSFIILDESQNTTKEQMKMFLTRIGFGSTAVITGDISQIDLPHGVTPGLKHAIDVLRAVKGISFTYFEAGDVVRHPLIQEIVRAYDDYENKK